MLEVTIPENYGIERRYILHVVFDCFWRQPYRLRVESRQDVKITCSSSAGEVHVADVLFQTPPDRWLTADSLPAEPVASGPPCPSLGSECLPLLFAARRRSEPGDSEGCLTIDLDVFGSAFFLLTQYEQAVSRERDGHARFLARHSLLQRNNLLLRPLVHEYLEVLWSALIRLWPQLKRPQRSARVRMTHDVDRPWEPARLSPSALMRASCGDLFKRRDPSLAVHRWYQQGPWVQAPESRKLQGTFQTLMNESERRNWKSAFYFLTAATDPLDADYEIDDPAICDLLREVHQRGHEIGLHPSYHTFRDAQQTRHEFLRLQTVCEQLGIDQPTWGGRQHYLRWDTGYTWRYWEQAGLDYDSTLGFSDAVGFRTGCCYEYPAFDLRHQEVLRLRERPLLVMDVTLANSMDVPWSTALDQVGQVYAECRKHGGDFTLLWHNTMVWSPRDRRRFQDVLDLLD